MVLAAAAEAEAEGLARMLIKEVEEARMSMKEEDPTALGSRNWTQIRKWREEKQTRKSMTSPPARKEEDLWTPKK